jgi:hypothetical protein
MATVHLQSGLLEQVSDNEQGSSIPNSLTRRALLVYEGEFESMDGVVNVGRDELTTLATNHNGHIESASRLAEGKESMKDYPPVQLDHSTSAKDTVGRLIGKLELGPYKTKDGREVMAAYGNVKILGEENVVKVMDGRWTHLSVGVDFERGKFSELTITPFPAAPEASLLKNNLAARKSVVKTSDHNGRKFRIVKHETEDDTEFVTEVYLEKSGFVDVATSSTQSEAEQEAVSYIKDLESEDDELSSVGNEMNKIKLARWHKDSGEAFGYAEEAYVAESSDGEAYALVAYFDSEGWVWEIVKDGGVKPIVHGDGSSESDCKAKAEAAAKQKGIKLLSSKQLWRRLMDKEKMKKHAMGKDSIPQDICKVCKKPQSDCECTDEDVLSLNKEETKKMAAEVEEHEKKMAAEKDEKKEEMSKTEDSEKKEMSEEKPDEKKEMSEKEDEEKKELSEKDKDEKKDEPSEKDKKMAAAREQIVRLSSDFRKAFDGAQLAARKGKILSRLSALRSSAKITPAEIKKIDVSKLAGQGDETVELVLKTYEDREPVIMTGALGSIKAHDLHELSKEIRMTKLEAETRKNMSLLKNTVKAKKLAEGPEEVSIHVDTTPHVHQEMAQCYGDACKLMDEGKLAEAKELLKKYMMKPSSEGRMDMVEQDKQLSALAEESIKMQNKFDELQKLAVSLVG